MTIATPADVAARLGRPLTDEETEQAQALLSDAEALIRRRIADLDAKTAADVNYRAVVVSVECSAVMRVLRNVSGINSETVGDYTISFSSYSASGAMTILDTEWSWLGAASGAFTITPSLPAPNQVVSPSLWLSSDCLGGDVL